MFDKVVYEGGVWRPLACIYYHFCQPCSGNRYLLASTAAVTQTGIDIDGIWVLSLDGKPRKLIVDFRTEGYSLSTKAVIFKQVDSRTIALLQTTRLLFFIMPLAGQFANFDSPQTGNASDSKRTRTVANLHRPADHTFPAENSLSRAKLFAEKTDLSFVIKNSSVAAVPQPSQISFFNLKSRKLLKTRKFAVRCDLLKCLNVYPDISGSGRILVIMSTGGPKPSPNLDVRLFDPKNDLESRLLGPEAYVGDVPNPERFKDSIYCNALYTRDFAVISQIFFINNQFANPHITVIRFEYKDTNNQAAEDGEGAEWVTKKSVHSYLIPGASLFIQLIGVSDDGSRVLCTDMTNKRFWISVADGKNHGYH